ncbi:hypothetical protein [Diplocloster hominis]|uniref:hypothetical protein n=1 Tax=Diplocloster hominis TaxID=3079010 RepID=UPI0031BB1656
MTIREFEGEVAKILLPGETAPSITNKEFEAIEKVYQYHPSISDVDGKEQIASFYANYGMAIIMDMLPRAELMEVKEKQLMAAREALRKVEEEIKSIRKGGRIDA